MIEYEGFFQQLSAFARKDCFLRRFAELVTPNLVARIGNQKTADESTHAMTDQHDAFVVWERASHGIELLAEKRSRVWVWVAAGITINRKLVTSPNLRITSQSVNHRSPGHEGISRAVDENYRNPIRIVWLQTDQSPRVSGFLRRY